MRVYDVLFWLAVLIITSVLTKKAGISKKMLLGAEQSIRLLKKKADEFVSNPLRLENGEFKKLSAAASLKAAKRETVLLKHAVKAHNILSVYCFDHRMDKESAEVLSSVDKVMEICRKIGKADVQSAEAYLLLLKMLSDEVNRAESLINEIRD